MTLDTLHGFIKKNDYTLKIARGLLLLLIYELVGFVFYYLYKQYKLYKAEKLALDKNKKLIILDELTKVKLLSQYENNSCVVIIDCLLEKVNIEEDEYIRNEIDRIAGKNIRHIYKPFFLLSSILFSNRIFYTADRINERYIDVSSIYSKIVLVLIYIILFTLLANYTPLKKYINEAFKLLINKTEKNFIDSEMNVNKNNIFSEGYYDIRVLTDVKNELNYNDKYNLSDNLTDNIKNNMENIRLGINNNVDMYNNVDIYGNIIKKNINEINNKFNNNVDMYGNIIKKNLNEINNRLNNNVDIYGNNVKNNINKISNEFNNNVNYLSKNIRNRLNKID